MNHRLFVAIDFPDSIKAGLSMLRFSLPPPERWIELDQLHLTLRFIGEVDGGLFREIKEKLDQIKFEPFELTLKGVGAFHSAREARILWAGVEDIKDLKILKNKIERGFRELSLEPEQRKFSPHITLARLKNTPVSYVGHFMELFNLYRSSSFEVKKFHLYSAKRTSNGMYYQQEVTYSL